MHHYAQMGQDLKHVREVKKDLVDVRLSFSDPAEQTIRFYFHQHPSRSRRRPVADLGTSYSTIQIS